MVYMNIVGVNGDPHANTITSHEEEKSVLLLRLQINSLTNGALTFMSMDPNILNSFNYF